MAAACRPRERSRALRSHASAPLGPCDQARLRGLQISQLSQSLPGRVAAILPVYAMPRKRKQARCRDMPLRVDGALDVIFSRLQRLVAQRRSVREQQSNKFGLSAHSSLLVDALQVGLDCRLANAERARGFPGG
jgi:hypothetical protein